MGAAPWEAIYVSHVYRRTPRLGAKFPTDETVLKKTLVVDAEGSARGERAGDDGLTGRRRNFSRLFPEEKQIACA